MLVRCSLQSVVIAALLLITGLPAMAQYHSADTASDGSINLGELLRVIQLYNSPGFHCINGTEDGYAPDLDPLQQSCAPHDSDYIPQDWHISLSELSRIIQFFNSDGYHTECGTEDNFAPGPGSLYQCEETFFLPGRVPLTMVCIPSGSFMMGAAPGEQDSEAHEYPQHLVTFSEEFWMGKYEVTKAQWTSVMGTTPWSGHSNILYDPDSSAVYVSWGDTQSFISELNVLTGMVFRLPTEAEWEYACREGNHIPQIRFYWGDDTEYTIINDYAWWMGNAYDVDDWYAHVVGQKIPNAWGLYDMSGNVWEFCQDWYHSSYTDAPTDGSAWESPEGSSRILRGGCWGSDVRARSASRYYKDPSFGGDYFGFRLAR
ncbi:MAG TPA: formylglycine-generating enzyme family protein [Candidatus Hydrogenedentes bacterium]|nr:formylglycine-generating enzyme family protein [Candidatus Hydrogenedentota bacterium]